jgi:hypothetical protein
MPPLLIKEQRQTGFVCFVLSANVKPVYSEIRKKPKLLAEPCSVGLVKNVLLSDDAPNTKSLPVHLFYIGHFPIWNEIRHNSSDVNGKIMKETSRTQTTIPVEFLIKTLEGTSVEEYQLLRLHKKSNRREFRSVTGGILHVSGGAERDELAFQPDKIGIRTWKIVLGNLPTGQYGFLPPGWESRSISSSGKMYAFEIVAELRAQPSRNASNGRDAAEAAPPNRMFKER